MNTYQVESYQLGFRSNVIIYSYAKRGPTPNNADIILATKSAHTHIFEAMVSVPQGQISAQQITINTHISSPYYVLLILMCEGSSSHDFGAPFPGAAGPWSLFVSSPTYAVLAVYENLNKSLSNCTRPILVELLPNSRTVLPSYGSTSVRLVVTESE